AYIAASQRMSQRHVVLSSTIHQWISSLVRVSPDADKKKEKTHGWAGLAGISRHWIQRGSWSLHCHGSCQSRVHTTETPPITRPVPAPPQRRSAPSNPTAAR